MSGKKPERAGVLDLKRLTLSGLRQVERTTNRDIRAV